MDKGTEVFFRQLEAELPPGVSAAAALSETLSISTDSAYRRLRGDTDLSFREAAKLAATYGLSLDAAAGGGQITAFRQSGDPEKGLGGTLENMLDFLRRLEAAGEPRLIYFSTEIPVFHLLQYPRLFAFKQYYWSTMRDEAPPRYDGKFQLPDSLQPLIQEVVNRYLRISGSEVLFEEFIAGTLRQILYFHEAGFMPDADDALELYRDVLDLLGHLKAQARSGKKYLRGGHAVAGSGDFRLFYNEMIHSQNTAYAAAGDLEVVFLEHNVNRYMFTTDPAFCGVTASVLDEIMRKSLLISSVSERERNRFFNRLESRTEKMIARVALSD